ncbi:NAD(P)H-binding protein [Nocardia sp. NBC_00511]|uniref:NAD(P)H-binding protein n=1 Tax=Nocardia sp. NBC_00511 TaxID=2903591 RepID=UPI0030E40F7A
MTILVTGARGQVGRAVIDRLHTAGLPVRAATADPSALELPAGVDRAEWRDDPETLTAALKDVREVFLYANPATIDAILTAATRAGVEHAVLLSSGAAGHPGAAENFIGSRHLVVENALAASGLEVTALRPGGFASNSFSWIPAVTSGQPIEHPYPEASQTLIHPLDIADLAVSALTGGEPRGRTVTLSGPEAVSFRAQVTQLGAALGREIPLVTIDPGRARAQMIRTMPPEIADSLLTYWAASLDHPETIDDTTATLLGVPARTYAQWARDNIAAFTPH